MNNDLISRAEAIQAARHAWAKGLEPSQYIEIMPAVDAAPARHGLWEEKMEHAGYVCCSVCHDCYVEKEWLLNLKWGWCPQCGARMDGGDNHA